MDGNKLRCPTIGLRRLGSLGRVPMANQVAPPMPGPPTSMQKKSLVKSLPSSASTLDVSSPGHLPTPSPPKDNEVALHLQQVQSY